MLHKHPHWKMLVAPVLAFLLIVAAGAFVAALAAGQSWEFYGWIAVGVIGGIGVGWLTLAPLLRWRTTHFIVTNRRVLVREGVLTRTGIDIPLNRVNSVQFRHSFVERMLGVGTLMVESASDEPLEFDDIPQVERVHSLLYRQVNPNAPGSGSQTGDGRR
ncbi:MAG: PH domain-containing protein [Pseudonocardiaceae bacterium]|nr:PH domain-containing protein [Pseudonocardiaceae bacterium]